MKLLTVEQSKYQANELLARDIMRANEIKDVLKRYEDRLVKSEKDFEEKLRLQREIWKTDLSAFLVEKDSLSKQVEFLQEKQKQALIPLTMREKNVESMEKELSQQIQVVKKGRQDNEEMKDLLAEKLNRVGEQETDMAQREVTLQIREKGCEDQRKSIALQAKELTLTMTKFQEEYEKKTHELSARETIVNQKNLAVEEREKSIINTEKDLKKKESSLKERYAQLEQSKKQIHGIKH